MIRSPRLTRPGSWNVLILSFIAALALYAPPALAQGGGWQIQNLPVPPSGQTYNIASVSAISAQEVWAAGHVTPGYDTVVFKSTDGGAILSLVSGPSTGQPVTRLKMVDQSMGFLTGTQFLFRRTFDGGATWNPEPNPDPSGPTPYVGPQGQIYGLTAPDADHPWTAGYDSGAGLIYHRRPEQPYPTPSNANAPWWQEMSGAPTLNGIDAVSTSTAWAVGEQGHVWKTTSNGDSWSQQTSARDILYPLVPAFNHPSLKDVDAVDANTAWAVGLAGQGVIIKTTDGGTTWVVQSIPTTTTLNRVAAVDVNTAWAVGESGVILRTIDGGTTWTRQFSGTTNNLTDVEAVSATTAWISVAGGSLLKTTDGGAGTWAVPTITSVTPSLVALNGNTTVTLTGTGFRAGATAVTFGGIAAQSVTWISPTTVQVVTPQFGGLTPQSVTFTNEDGQSVTLANAITPIRGPVITGFSPWHGSIAGGYQITIDGWYLQTVNAANLVMWRSGWVREPLSVSVVSGTSVVVSVPSSSTRTSDDGKAYIELLTPQGAAVSAGAFRLDPTTGPVFAVDSMTPQQLTWGTVITVTGVGFAADATFRFDGEYAVISSQSATQMVGSINRPGSIDDGWCQLDVYSGSDSATVDPAALWTSMATPTITQVNPASGSTSGDTTVTITGTNLDQLGGQATVLFDNSEATVVSRAATQLVVTTPPHAAGAVNVTVIPTDDYGNQVGPSATAPNAFTYASIGIPQIQITPSSLYFGYVPPGSYKDMTLVVKNIGTGTLTGTVSASAPFSFVSGGSLVSEVSYSSLGTGETNQVIVRYTAPLEEGSQTGSLVFTGGGGITIQAKGTNKQVGLPWLMLLLD